MTKTEQYRKALEFLAGTNCPPHGLERNCVKNNLECSGCLREYARAALEGNPRNVKAEYEKLSEFQRRDIDDFVQEAINGIIGMRGDNDSGASPIHACLNDIYAVLCDLQDAGWSFFRDACIYGTAIWKTGKRKWYNPLRYFRGKHYRKNIRWESVLR